VTAPRRERLLRWYPPQWRSRYGDELTALLEDRYGPAGGVPVGDRIGLVRAGLTERAREGGFVGSTQGRAARLRAGSVLVLCGWTLFLVAGAMFAKFSDNWLAGTPRADRSVASWSYDVVAVAGMLGCAVTLLAAFVAVPAFARFVRHGGWAPVRRPVLRAVVGVAAAAVALGAVLFWAHHLSSHDRNGGGPLYGALFVVVSVAAVAALAWSTAAAVSVVRRIDWPARTLGVLAALAVGICGLMLVTFAGIVTWWVSEVLHAPGVLLDGIGGGVPFDSRFVPPTLLVVGSLMVAGLALGLGGTLRIARAARQGGSAA